MASPIITGIMNNPDVAIIGVLVGVFIGKFALCRRRRGMGMGGF